MKLIRFGKEKNEKPGILNEQNERLDLSDFFKDWDSDFLATNGLEKLRDIILSGQNLPLVSSDERWGPCIARPHKLICIGLNYLDHAQESGMNIPEEPVIFMKATNTITGPYDNIPIPRGSTKTDWKVELAVIIDKEASYLHSVHDSKDCIIGYCVSHDISERTFQLERGGQWTKGKSCKNFNPLGPFMVTTEEIPSINQLEMILKVNNIIMQHSNTNKMILKVNNIIMQHSNTNKMIFDVDHIIWYLSQFMVLEPGDVISTGTPSGVGMGRNPPLYLKHLDEVELEIEGLGKQKQVFISS